MRSKRIMFLMLELMIFSMSSDPDQLPSDDAYRHRLERLRRQLHHGDFDRLLSELENEVFGSFEKRLSVMESMELVEA